MEGYIRNEPFEPKEWPVPGDTSKASSLCEGLISTTTTIYIIGRRKIKMKTVADVVEALLGAYVSSGGEIAGLMLMDWLGMKVDFTISPYERSSILSPTKHVNVKDIESLLHYSFQDPSLLVEALTHGSYMLPEIPKCYQVIC